MMWFSLLLGAILVANPMLAVLRQTILDEPDDDLPRLAYADILEETGEDLERAEFIRLQIEHCHFLASGALMNDEQREKRTRFYSLLTARRHDWFPEFHPTHSAWRAEPPTFFVNRGFLDGIDMTADEFGCAPMKDLFTRHPLRKIRIIDQWHAYSEKISSQIDKRLRVLELGPWSRLTRSDAISLCSFSKHIGWKDTLEELSYELGNANAWDFLIKELPKVRIRHEGVLYSANFGEGRIILEHPRLATTNTPNS